MARHRLVDGLALVAVLVLVGCSSPAPVRAPSGLDTMQQAYNTLLDSYVQPLDPSVLALGAASGMASSLGRRHIALSASDVPAFTDGSRQQVWQELSQAYTTLATRYGEQVDPNVLAYDAIRSMAASVDDCHTVFSSPSEVADEQAQLQGTAKFGGIGAFLLDEPGDPPAIREVFADGPADKAGIKPGDVIRQVNGRDVDSLAARDVASLIRGPEGTTVALTLERRGVDSTYSIVRQQVSPPVVNFSIYTVMGHKVGYVHLYSFPASILDRVNPGLDAIEKRGVQGWVIDLRDNGGGELDSLQAFAGRFLHRGPLDGLVDRRGRMTFVQPTGTTLQHPQPLAVLVNENSASASEMFAAAVQEQGAGKVVGQRTSGCFGVAQEFKMRDGSGLQLKVQNVVSGLQRVPLGGDGVVPDVSVGLTTADLEASKDPQLAMAFQTVVGQLGS